MADDPPVLSDVLAEADRLEDQWRWAESLEAWDAARAAAAGDERALGDCEAGRARLLFALGRPDEADAADQAARAHYEAAGCLALALVCEANQAWQAGMRGDLDTATARVAAAVEALDALGSATGDDGAGSPAPEPDDEHELAVARGRARQVLARLQFASDRPDEGTATYLAARDLFADAADARRVARCDAALAADLLGVGRVEDAEGRAESALAAFTMLDAVADAGRMDLILGQIRGADGSRADEALASFTSAKERFAAAGLPAFQAEALHLEGLMLTSLGRDDDAVDSFEEAIEVGDDAGLSAGVAMTRLELGPALARLGHDADALACLVAARDQLEAEGDGLASARAAYAIGAVHREHGRYEEALGELLAAANGFAAGGMGAAVGQVRLEGGMLLDSLAHAAAAVDPTRPDAGDGEAAPVTAAPLDAAPLDEARIDEALAWFDEAAKAFETEGDPRFVAIARRAWGTSAGFADRPGGLDAIEAARAVLSEHDAGWEVAECDAAAARVLGHDRRFAEGATRSGDAVAGFHAAGDPVAAAAAGLLHGQLLADAGQGDAAIEAINQVLSSAIDLGIGPLAGAAHATLANVLGGLGRAEEAATHQAAAERLLAEA